MFLRHPRLPLELLIEKPTAAAVQSTDEYVQRTEANMRKAYALVREALKANFDRSKKRYDARVRAVQFKEGALVYYYVPRKHVGKNKKWALDNRGPFRIVRKINDVNYVIQKAPGAVPITVHVDRLTRHHEKPSEQLSPQSSEQPVEAGTTSNTKSAVSSQTLNSESCLLYTSPSPRD